MEDTLFRGNREPTLDQILAEPIVRIVMQRDGIDERAVRELMRKAASAKPPPPVHFVPPVPRSGLPQAGIGILAEVAAEPRWPRVFPSL